MSSPHATKPPLASSIRIRVIATRGLDGWTYRLGRPSRLADSYAETLLAWLPASVAGDEAVWFREYVVQDGVGVGASGLRLVRGETVLLQELASRLG